MTLVDRVEREAGGLRRHRRAILRSVAVWIILLGLFIFSWVRWDYFQLAIIGLLSTSLPLVAEVGLFMCMVTLLGSLLYAITTLLEGRKTAVLYLRRFRLAGAHQMISTAIQSGLGRQYRVVTLDDRSFKPLEVPSLDKRFSRYGPIALAFAIPAIIIAFFGLLIMGFSGPNPAFGAVMVAGFVVAAWPYILFLLWLACIASGFLLVHRRRVRKRSRLKVQTSLDVRKCLIRVAALSSRVRGSRFMAPQATVVEVAGGLWQEIVAKLSARLEAVVIDVSTVTENLVWELSHLSSTMLPKCVLVGERIRILGWTNSQNLEPGTPAERARNLLENRPVLIYTIGGWRETRRFRRSLTNALDNICGVTRAQLSRGTVEQFGLTFGERTRLFAQGILTYAVSAVLSSCIFFGALYLLVQVGVLQKR